MVVVPLTKPGNALDEEALDCDSTCVSWVTIAAAGTLAAGGALLLCGRPRLGMVAAATGAALAMLDQQETVAEWWRAMPSYLGEVQNILGRVQETLDDIGAQHERLHKSLTQ